MLFMPARTAVATLMAIYATLKTNAGRDLVGTPHLHMAKPMTNMALHSAMLAGAVSRTAHECYVPLTAAAVAILLGPHSGRQLGVATEHFIGRALGAFHG